MRLTNSDLIAFKLVNQIRIRVYVARFTSLDADKILDERMIRFFNETIKRSDQIRSTGTQGAIKI